MNLAERLNEVVASARPKIPSWGAKLATADDVSEYIIKLCQRGWTPERAIERVYQHPRLRQLMDPAFLKERERYHAMRTQKKAAA